MARLTLAHLTASASPADTIEAAAAAGFDAVGIRVCPRRPGNAYAGTVLGDAAATRHLRSVLKTAGIPLSNVSAYQFYPEVGWEDIAPVVELTAELGGEMIVANGFDPDLGRFAELLSRYAGLAAQAGIRVALEFMPYSAVRTVEDARALVDRVAAPNLGVLVDALHLDRSGGRPADVAALRPEDISFAQLCDARHLRAPLSNAELMQEARTSRLPLGEGELPLFELMDALPSDLELEYEVARADLADASALERARAAKADADRFLARRRARSAA
ncbi:AP endonuclease, family 2 [Acetobacteraceae bacterium AT-5844]|nr:AP endonuclease, family 2 [Acetobacteraceae bacterium AT-5844]